MSDLLSDGSGPHVLFFSVLLFLVSKLHILLLALLSLSFQTKLAERKRHILSLHASWFFVLFLAHCHDVLAWCLLFINICRMTVQKITCALHF